MLAWRQRDGCVSIFRSSWAGGRGNRRVMDRRGDSCAAPEASDGDPHGAARWDEALAGGQGGNAKPVRSASPCASGAPMPPIDPEPSDTADREPRLVIPSAPPAPRPLQPGPPSPPQSGLQQGGWARLAPLGLMCLLTVQAVLSMRLIWSNTAFLDEATYLYVASSRNAVLDQMSLMDKTAWTVRRHIRPRGASRAQPPCCRPDWGGLGGPGCSGRGAGGADGITSLGSRSAVSDGSGSIGGIGAPLAQGEADRTGFALPP